MYSTHDLHKETRKYTEKVMKKQLHIIYPSSQSSFFIMRVGFRSVRLSTQLLYVYIYECVFGSFLSISFASPNARALTVSLYFVLPLALAESLRYADRSQLLLSTFVGFIIFYFHIITSCYFPLNSFFRRKTNDNTSSLYSPFFVNRP